MGTAVTIGQDVASDTRSSLKLRKTSQERNALTIKSMSNSVKTIKALNDTCSTQKEQLGKLSSEKKLQEDYDEIKRHMSVEQANSQRHVAELEKKLAESELQLKNARREHNKAFEMISRVSMKLKR